MKDARDNYALEERQIRVETALAHLQHDCEQMHQVLLALQSEMAAVQKTLRLMDSRIVRLAEEPEVRDPEEERPPHY